MNLVNKIKILTWLRAAIREKRVPPSFCIYDTETYSEQDIKAGAMKYHSHKSTELTMLQYLVIRDGIPETEDVQLWEQGDEPPQPFFQAVEDKLPMVVFNLLFERFLYELILVPECGYPEIAPLSWIDTSSLSRVLGIQGSLDNTLTALNIPYTKQKDGKALIRWFCIPRKPTKNNASTRNMPKDHPERWEKFRNYGKTDTWVTLALFTQTVPLSKFEAKIQEINYRANFKGLPIDVPSVKTAITFAQRIKVTLTKQVEEITKGISPTQVGKLTEWLGMKNLQAKTVSDKLMEKDLSPEVKQVLEARQVLGKTSVSKLQKMIDCATYDNRISGGFLYIGAARTGRDAGRLVQPHNFPRPSLSYAEIEEVFTYLRNEDYDGFVARFPNPGEALSSSLRGMINAPEGKEFNVADYAAIEARGLNWETGQNDMVALFSEGKDVYKEMASVIFNKPVPEISIDERKLGKDTVLGCGYGMGSKTFKTQIEEKGTPMTTALATKSVNAYRRRHKKIIKAWDDSEKAAKLAIRNPGTKYPIMCDRVFFYVSKIGINKFLIVKLPSGRKLYYLNPTLQAKNTSWGELKVSVRFDTLTGSKVHPEHTYGGKLVENITQAIARDIMVHGMYSAYKAGYSVLGTVHDEVISEVNVMETTAEEFEKVICRLPQWAVGFPINAEGYIADRYRK